MPTAELIAGNAAASKPYGGGIYRAPRGTALPTDASTALAVTYLPLGYISSDGIAPEFSTSIEKITAFGGDIVAALAGENDRAFSYTLIEVYGKNTNEFIFGTANVTITAAAGAVGTKTAVLDKATQVQDSVLVFELKHGLKRRRIVVPYGVSSVTGEGPFADTSLQSYSLSTTAIKDTTGVRVYDYLQNDDAPGA